MSDIGHQHISVICHIGDEKATALRYPVRVICCVWFTTSQWLQVSATRHSTYCVRGGHKMPLHGGTTVWRLGRVLVLDRWATRCQGNSLSCHSCRTVLYEDGTTSVKIMINEINRLDKLGNTNHRRRRRWWSMYTSWVGRKRRLQHKH